jgi:6,7-dimethyl-8-ribityllumazine synthase
MKTEKPTVLPDAAGKSFAIVVADFYADLAAWLENGARRGLRDCGVDDAAIQTVRVPGCFELPLAARRLIAGGKIDGVVALGVVIRGETPHFDFVAAETASGIQLAGIETGVPVAFGVLTVETIDQAEARVDRAAEAVRTALEMADLFARLRASARVA